MLFNFVFLAANAGVPTSTALHAFNGKRCRVKFLGVNSRFATGDAAYVNNLLRLDFTCGLYAKHATIIAGGSNQQGSIQGIPFPTAPTFSSTTSHLEFDAELWGEMLELTISRAVDPPNTVSASLAMPAPLVWCVAHFDIEALE